MITEILNRVKLENPKIKNPKVENPKIENPVYSYFKLPIEYQKKTQISKNLLEDLEMVTTIDASNTSIYKHLFKPTNTFGEQCILSWSKYFTTDHHFLKDSQKFYHSMNTFKTDNDIVNSMNDSWTNIKKTW